MRRIQCNECQKTWYIDDDIIDISVCPFCSKSIKDQDAAFKVDTLGKAIYQAVSSKGTDFLSSLSEISRFLLDMAEETKLTREIKIFCKTFNDDYLKIYKDCFSMNLTDAENTLNRMEQLFIEDEGLSDTWSKTLCENCLMAIKYFNGSELPVSISAEITEFVSSSNKNSETLQNSLITENDYAKDRQLRKCINLHYLATNKHEKYRADYENALFFYQNIYNGSETDIIK